MQQDEKDSIPGSDAEQFVKQLASARKDRRDFMKHLAVGAASLAGAGLLAKGAQAQRGALDPAVLNFALNLEYLEAEFYLRAIGQTLSAEDSGGTGTVTGGSTVTFNTVEVAAYAAEIAADELAHVRFLRAALGSAAVSRPNLNLDTSFAAAGAAIGVPGFNPFAAGDIGFLLGAFVFEDVGVTAYKGGARLLTNKDFLEAAAGILAVEAYHAGEVRTVLFGQRATVVPGSGGQNVGQLVQRISDLRDSVDAADGSGTAGDDRDQGIVTDPLTGGLSNVVPTDANGLAFSRNTSQVLRIVYLGGAPGTGGGFFPNGLNGAIR